jgi:CHASE3 domain sensor protein
MDSAQKEKLAVIVNQSRDRYRALSKQFRPQYDAIRAETRQEMRQILHENQKARFEELIQEMDSRRSGRRPPNSKP